MNARITYIITLICLISIQIHSQAQCTFPYQSDAGAFRVNQIKGCLPLTVEVCLTPSAPSSCDPSDLPCFFDWGDGPSSDQFVHEYTTAGTFTLEINFSSSIDQIQIEVVDKPAPEFDVFACAGDRVSVDILDNQYDNYFIDFGDGTTIITPSSTINQEHSYTNTNPKTITVQGVDDNALDNCPVGTATFDPVAVLPAPEITRLEVLNRDELELTYSLNTNLKYRLEIQPNGSGNFNFLKSIDNETTAETIANLDLEENYYCFRAAAEDPCTPGTFTYSNTICSIDLNLQIQDGENLLDWNTNNPDGNFRVARTVTQGNNSNETNPYERIGSTTRSFADNDITCNTSYCYRLEANYGNGVSVSNEACGVGVTTEGPDPVSDLSIVIDQGASLFWSPQGQSDYTVFSPGLEPSTTKAIEFRDNRSSLGLEAPVCYTVSLTDECGNAADTDQAICSIFLRGSISRQNEVTLNWNRYQGFDNGVGAYQVYKFYGQNAAGVMQINTNAFSEVDDNDSEQVINYYIEATPASSNLPPARSNTITLIKPNNLYYPTAFTPDGTGVAENETFSVRARYIVDYNLQIFNRWGEMIYATTNPDEGWDGTYNGQRQQEGTYVFNLTMTDQAGREIQRNGSFLLLRKR